MSTVKLHYFIFGIFLQVRIHFLFQYLSIEIYPSIGENCFEITFPEFSIFYYFLQILINNANGNPVCPGEYESGYESRNYEWGPSPSIIPFPQPVPVREPQRENYQSVTIPNIIVALLPPTNKPVPAVPVVQPKPVSRPPPVVLPAPKPYAFSSYPRFSGFGGSYGGGYGGYGGYGSGFGSEGSTFGGCGCA